MKSISASIVVLAGTSLMALGGMINHGETSTGLMCIGGVVAFLGMAGWVGAMMDMLR